MRRYADRINQFRHNSLFHTNQRKLFQVLNGNVQGQADTETVVNSNNSCSQPCCSPAPSQAKSLIVLLLLNSMDWAGHAIPAQQFKIHERMQHQSLLRCAVLQELHLVQALLPSINNQVYFKFNLCLDTGIGAD